MPRRDPNTRDLSHQKLRLAEDVLVWPVREQGKLVYRLEIPKLHRFFRVGYEEYVFLSLLNGERTVPQACGLAAAKLGRRAPTAAQAGSIVRWLVQNELAVFDSDPMPIRNPARAAETQNPNRSARWIRQFNPFWMKFPFPKLDYVINQLAKQLTFLFDPRVVGVGIVLIFVGVATWMANADEFVASSARLIHFSNWIWLLVSWVLLKVFHEMAHAIACNRQGAEVRESGLVLILFAPMAYVDVTSCWRLNSRWSRMGVAAAGMYVELVIAAAAMIGWLMIDAPFVRFLLHNLVFTAGLSTLLFNANALMRFDGYFILADLIEVPNLYQEASQSVRRWMSRLLTGERATPSHLVGWRSYFVTLYGFAALAWRVTICISLGVAASTMFAGAGVVIAALGVCMWLGRPLQQLSLSAYRLRNKDPLLFARAVIVASVLGLAVTATFFWVPVPTAIRVATVSRHSPETTVRSGADGFVTAVHVRDGSRVKRGQLLLELENRELSNQLRQLELEYQQCEVRLRQATAAHEIGESHVLRENKRAIVEQRNQLRLQANQLLVMAPRDGRVVARGLASMLGTHVKEGDQLMVVASPGEKELVAFIPQGEVDSARSLVGTDVMVRTANFTAITARLERIEPRADVRLDEVSLAATEGGSLAVEVIDEATPETSLRLVEPHFRGRIDLPSEVAGQIPAGMRMVASLGYRREPAAARLRQIVRQLWREAHAAK